MGATLEAVRPESLHAQEEAEALITHLQLETESHRETLARSIHDNLGGLLVSATMDFAAARHQLEVYDPSILPLFDRGKAALEAAIDLIRQMVEDLRPSILDNFGLFAALRWQLNKASHESSAKLTECFPTAEPDFPPLLRTSLFRIAQEAIAMIFRRRDVRSVNVLFQLGDGEIVLSFTDDGVPALVDGLEVGTAHALASMKHRIRPLGGIIKMQRYDGGTVMTAQVPFPRLR